VQLPDLGVLHVAYVLSAMSDVGTGPEHSEAIAADRELADQRSQAWVVGVGAGRCAESADHAGGRAVPVQVQLAVARVEEHQAQHVAARREVR
jgi:hypothetical protein